MNSTSPKARSLKHSTDFWTTTRNSSCQKRRATWFQLKGSGSSPPRILCPTREEKNSRRHSATVSLRSLSPRFPVPTQNSSSRRNACIYHHRTPHSCLMCRNHSTSIVSMTI
jgi:hypothetical protein